MKNMASKEQKIKEIKEFIKDNPSLNSNEILKEIRLKGLGIRKQEFQILFRKEKQISQPTKEKRLKSIPKKFRKEKEIKEIKQIKEIKVRKEAKAKAEKENEKEREAKPTKITKLPIKPKKEGKYGVIEVIDDEGNSFWIKYQNKKDFNRQLEKIKSKYAIKKLKLVSHGFRNYVDFIDKEFMEILQSEGIKS